MGMDGGVRVGRKEGQSWEENGGGANASVADTTIMTDVDGVLLSSFPPHGASLEHDPTLSRAFSPAEKY